MSSNDPTQRPEVTYREHFSYALPGVYVQDLYHGIRGWMTVLVQGAQVQNMYCPDLQRHVRGTLVGWEDMVAGGSGYYKRVYVRTGVDSVAECTLHYSISLHEL